MDGVSGWLLTQGPLGVGILALVFALVQIWRRYEEANARIQQLQELRVTDATNYGERMEKLALSSTQAVRRLYRALGEKDDNLEPPR